jgi:hypothetical protein
VERALPKPTGLTNQPLVKLTLSWAEPVFYRWFTDTGIIGLVTSSDSCTAGDIRVFDPGEPRSCGNDVPPRAEAQLRMADRALVKSACYVTRTSGISQGGFSGCKSHTALTLRWERLPRIEATSISELELGQCNNCGQGFFLWRAANKKKKKKSIRVK